MADLSSYTDEELKEAAGIGAVPSGGTSSMSNEELMQIAGLSIPTATPESSLLYDLASGPVRSAVKTTALVGDALAYPFRKGIEYLSGKEVPTMQAQAEEDLAKLGLVDTGSFAQKASGYALPIFPAAKGLQALTGLAAAGGEEIAGAVFPESEIAPIAGGLLAGMAPSGILGTGKSIFTRLSPKVGATKEAQAIAEEVQKVIPTALKAQVGKEQVKEAGKLFEKIPTEGVVLDDAIQNISKYIEEVSGPLDPKGSTGKLVEYLKTQKPPDEVIRTPASIILDASGKPIVEATERIIEGGPARLPLDKVQNFLANVNTQFGRGSERRVNDVILKKVKDEILGAVKTSVSPEALASFQGARGAYASAKNVQRREQLLEKLFRRTPVSWDTFVNQKKDDFIKLFGEEKTAQLRQIFGPDGTVGKKLLQDNAGLKTLFTRVGLRPLIGAATGSLFGTKEALVGAAAAVATQKVEGQKIARIKKILMNAAANDETALAILSQKAKSINYEEALAKLGTILGQQFNEDQPKDTKAELSQEPMSIALENATTPPTSSPSPISPEKVAFNGFNSSNGKNEAILDAIMQVESGGNPNAISPVGAEGAYQIMPPTAKNIMIDIGLDPSTYNSKDVALQRKLAEHYLFNMLPKMLPEGEGSLENILAAYNAGPGRVKNALAGNQNLPQETINYKEKILRLLQKGA